MYKKALDETNLRRGAKIRGNGHTYSTHGRLGALFTSHQGASQSSISGNSPPPGGLGLATA